MYAFNFLESPLTYAVLPLSLIFVYLGNSSRTALASDNLEIYEVPPKK